jgi:hypothetical protein
LPFSPLLIILNEKADNLPDGPLIVKITRKVNLKAIDYLFEKIIRIRRRRVERKDIRSIGNIEISIQKPDGEVFTIIFLDKSS